MKYGWLRLCSVFSLSIGSILAPFAGAQEGLESHEENLLRFESSEKDGPLQTGRTLGSDEATFPLFLETKEGDEFSEDGPRKNLFYAGFGAAFWPRLRDLEPRDSFDTSEGFGSFDSWGVSVTTGYQRRVLGESRVELWLGGEVGIIEFAERKDFRVRLPSGEVVDDETSLNVAYIAATASARSSLGPLDLVLGTGLGLYQLAIYEEEDRHYRDDDRFFDDTDLGGFVSVGFEWEIGEDISLILEDKVHIFHFDDLRRITPGRDSIDGPVNVLQIGVSFRF